MNKKILLIYPESGPYGFVFKDLPLSLLHLSSVCVKEGYAVKILDQRIITKKDWIKKLYFELDNKPLFAGISVMSGYPIKYALDITKTIKNYSHGIKVTWGGIHPSILPEQTLANTNIDFVVRKCGETALIELSEYLNGLRNIESVKGLSYKSNGKYMHNEDSPPLNLNAIPEIPYNLVNVDDYYRIGLKEKTFSLLTSRYCPHECSFCYSPIYGERKWVSQTPEKIFQKIKFAVENFKPSNITFIDDDFFVNLQNVKILFEKIIEIKNNEDSGLWKKLTFNFRGVRVDELDKMDDSFFNLLTNIGGKYLHIGAESGSDRILSLMKKKIKAEQTLAINRKLRKYDKLIPSYNFFSGIPTETYEELLASGNLVLQLVKENPRAQIVGFAQYTPWPGTELYYLGIKHGFREPQSLEEWSEIDDAENAAKLPWLSKKFIRKIELMYFASFFIDNKIKNMFDKKNFFGAIFYIFSIIYKPIAKFRFSAKTNFLPIESILYKSAIRFWKLFIGIR
ncbi:MAG TPA: radical SAM protein [bacterium]|nr:radical SAM protein [bacterium]HPN29558.1 radical SAM protein [bacterium]